MTFPDKHQLIIDGLPMNSYRHKLVLLSERSERKGPRAPEAKFGKQKIING
jgi:hypothetical protein